MPEDLYKHFASQYHLFYEGFDKFDAAYVNFYETIIKKHNIKTVLDCACGIGRDIFMFHTLGCTAFGSDISESMLKQARINLANQGITIPIQKVDFRNLHTFYSEKFDCVVCLSTSLPHLLKRQEILKALRSMRKVLKAGGLLILTTGFTDKFVEDQTRFVCEKNTEEFSRIMAIDYHTKTVTINVLDIKHSRNESDFRVYSFDYLLLLKDDYKELLTKSGFPSIRFYGNYTFEKYNRTKSDKLIIIAQT